MPPAGVRRRGTVLLMVIGVLAMLAILAIVYASLGQADRRTSTAYVRSVQVQDISKQFGDYLADIIGQDATQTITEEYAGRLHRTSRVTWTYPSIPFDDTIKTDTANITGTRYSPDLPGYQPWLAPAEPTFLRYNGSPAFTDGNRQYLDYRDWATISNVVPNGQFVNLANLRNNFFAEPGVGLDATGHRRMSMGLTLFDRTSGLPQTSNTARLEDGRPADLNIPWNWTARQVRAARPIINFRTGANQPGPAQDEFLLNQWADADGDGIADSRWFELNASAGPFAEWIAPGLAQQDKTRYFAAVRIVDMAGMTNISTAMDLVPPPGGAAPNDNPTSTAFPLGTTPSDIDLLRLLTLTDAYSRYGVGYNAFMQPSTLMDPGNYTQYVNTSGSPAAKLVGLSAYNALQYCISADRNSDPNLKVRGDVPGYDPRIYFDIPYYTTAAQREEFYRFSQLDPTDIGYSAQTLVYPPNQPNDPPATGFKSRLPFGMAEELELHDFFGVNDPTERSRLESVLDGRRIGANPSYPNFGPLRSNRPLEVERDRAGIIRADGQQDDTSLARQHLDIRHSITTFKASRPLTSLSPQHTFTPNAISDDEVRVDLNPYLYPRGPITDDSFRAMFNDACDALIPFRNITAADNLWSQSDRANAALFYGGSADFAMRSAAHWAVNIRDAADDDNSTNDDVAGPTAITLRLTRGASTTQTPEFPWKQVTLDNSNVELASSASDVESELVNIYGIEAQPFLAEAASYAFWMDVPWDGHIINGQATPDDEWTEGSNPGPGQPPRDVPITIKHDTTWANADFLGEIVAFQVTNPFERDLYLTKAGASTPKFLYYVEYANRFFPLAELDTGGTGGFVNADVKLKPGETRVFYATSPRHELNFNRRIEVGQSTARPVTFPAEGFLKAWVDRQFRLSSETGMTREPVHTAMFDPQTFALVDPESSGSGDVEDGLMDLQGENANPPATPADRRVVKLWRVLHSDWQSETDTTNLQSNDLLADRLRDPGTGAEPTLFQRLDSSTDEEVPGTVAGDDHHPSGPTGNGNPRDNTGFTIAMWGSIRRPTATDAAPAPRGAMPPWCIEARDDSIYNFSGRMSLNKDTDGPANRGNKADYGGADSRYRTLNALISDEAQGDGGARVNPEIRHEAKDKRGNTIPDSQSLDANGTPRKFAEQAVRIALGGHDASGHLWNAGLFRRNGDVLLPLAIGPYSDPSHANGPDTMTLSEVLALATDYYSPPNAHLYFHAGHSDLSSPGNPMRPKFDAGHFVIDNFVPFNDANHSGTYDPSSGNSKEAPIGLGIPVALNLLDKFQFGTYGNKAKGESGKTNINTATLASLSILPFLTPDPLADWMKKPVNPNSPTGRDLIYDPAKMQADRAAAFESYRDKIDVITRPTQNVTGGIALPQGAGSVVSFRDTTNPLINHWALTGRTARNLIPGIREDLGFRSPGEILAVLLRDRPITSTPPDPAGDPNAQYRTNSMDWYAVDQKPIKGQPGIDPVNIALDASMTPPVEGSDEVIDDYNEKIAIADAVLNSVTTRSDTFCVWFILNGYQQSDVENIGPNDPMIPTISKRFMMIVDRSNVIKKGDHPRILLFREVPM